MEEEDQNKKRRNEKITRKEGELMEENEDKNKRRRNEDNKQEEKDNSLKNMKT